MKREIKFRAWDGNKMIYGDNFFPVISLGGSVSWPCSVGYSEDTTSILMQYTGLCDKNGKEIYEGDIVRWNVQRDTKYGQVEDYYINHKVSFEGGAFYPVCQAGGEEFEIIGNIYENPELIKE